MTELKSKWLKGKRHRRTFDFNKFTVLFMAVFKPEKSSLCFPTTLFVPPDCDPRFTFMCCLCLGFYCSHIIIHSCCLLFHTELVLLLIRTWSISMDTADSNVVWQDFLIIHGLYNKKNKHIYAQPYCPKHLYMYNWASFLTKTEIFIYSHHSVWESWEQNN